MLNRLINRLRKGWERRKCPPDLLHLLGKPLNGYKFIQVWQIGGISSVLVDEPIKKCAEVEKASKYVEYLARDLSLPYILSLDKEWLIEILFQTYPPHIHNAWQTIIRPSLVMVTMGEGWAVPASGFDSRKIFPEEGKADLSMLPRWSWLLHGDDYHALVKKDELCFVMALKQTRTIRYLSTKT